MARTNIRREEYDGVCEINHAPFACGVYKCISACCRVLECVAVCWSVLKCVAL